MRTYSVVAFMVFSLFLTVVSPHISAAMTTPEPKNIPNAAKPEKALAPVAQVTDKNVTPAAPTKSAEKKAKKRRKAIKPYYGPDNTANETSSVKDRLTAARKNELSQKKSGDDSEEMSKDQTQPEKLTAAQKAKIRAAERAAERAAKRKHKKGGKNSASDAQQSSEEGLIKATPPTAETSQNKPSAFKKFGHGRSSLLNKSHM